MKLSLLLAVSLAVGAGCDGVPRFSLASTAPLRSKSEKSEATRVPAPDIEKLRSDLDHAVQLADNGQVEMAWEEFSALGSSLATPSPPAPAEAAPLEPVLLDLGRAFLQRAAFEEALAVWHVAARQGSSRAASQIDATLRQNGLPFWTDRTALSTFKLRTEALTDSIFGGAVLVSEGEMPLPVEADPLFHQRYRYDLAVYGPTSKAQRPKSQGVDTERLEQKFLLHYEHPSEARLAKQLARNFAVLNRLMEGKLARHNRFDIGKPIQVWLVSEGDAGGEQWQGHLYFYDLERPRSNLEWMRECAHEYGHISLPGTSGFTEPESWADGELGERLLLRWLGDSSKLRVPSSKSGDRNLEPGTWNPELLGFKASGLESYLNRYVEPLVKGFAERGWQPEIVAKHDRAAMEHVMGLALWAEEAHGTPFLRQMLTRVPNVGPTGLWAGYVRAFTERLSSAQGLAIRKVVGSTRFYLPKSGKYRVKSVSNSRISLVSASGATKSLTVASGQIWNAQAGWYQVSGSPGEIILRQAG